MPHIVRDVTGRIIAVLDRPSAGPTEEVSSDDPDLVAFLKDQPSLGERMQGAEDLPLFALADLDFIRVLDDLIAALLQRKVIALHDLPNDACRKLMERRALRNRIAAERPLISDDAEPIL